MKAKIIKRAPVNIPSASGVEIVNGIIYIIGDDSNTLFCLNHNLEIIQKLTLFESEYAPEQRIPKSEKPDLECLTFLKIHGYDYILINGSGSKKNRDKGYLVKLPSKFNKKFFNQEIDFSSLFGLLRANEEIIGNGALNLEATACNEKIFVMLNRANKKGNNVALVFNKEEMEVFLGENSEMVPFPSVIPYSLPEIDGIPSGFSGACIYEDKLFFTASAEDTADVIGDGDVTGSVVGWMSVNESGLLRGSERRSLSEIKEVCEITFEGAICNEKIESVSIYEKDSETRFIALAVVDNDAGASEIFMLEIELENI